MDYCMASWLLQGCPNPGRGFAISHLVSHPIVLIYELRLNLGNTTYFYFLPTTKLPIHVHHHQNNPRNNKSIRQLLLRWQYTVAFKDVAKTWPLNIYHSVYIRILINEGFYYGVSNIPYLTTKTLCDFLMLQMVPSINSLLCNHKHALAYSHN